LKSKAGQHADTEQKIQFPQLPHPWLPWIIFQSRIFYGLQFSRDRLAVPIEAPAKESNVMSFEETCQTKHSSWSTRLRWLQILLIASSIALEAISANAQSSTLLRRVQSALRSNNNLNGAAAYTTTPGVVVLYGTVFDHNDSALAEQTVRGVNGVTDVINTLRTSTGEWQEEESRINDTLQLNDLPGIQAKVVGLEVYLSGQTISEVEKQRAIRVVSSVSQLQVVDFMRVVPGPMFSTPSFF